MSREMIRQTGMAINSSEPCAAAVETSRGDRRHARHRGIALTVVSAGLTRVVSLVTALISVPLTIHYLGAERYSLWVTASASLALFRISRFRVVQRPAEYDCPESRSR